MPAAPDHSRQGHRGLLVGLTVVVIAGGVGAGIWRFARRQELVPAPNVVEPKVAEPKPMDEAPKVAPAPVVPSPRQPEAKLAPVEVPKKTPPEAPRDGQISVMVIPFANVFVDGVRVGETPVRGKSLKLGKHLLEIRNDGLHKSEKIPITVTAGKTVSISRKWGD